MSSQSKRYRLVTRPDGSTVAEEYTSLDPLPEIDETQPLGWLDRQREEFRLQARGVPARLAVVLRSPGSTPAMTAIETFFDDPKKLILVLAGGVGTGKTVAAAAAVANYSQSALMIKATDLSAHGMYGQDNQEFWDTCQAKALLAIDDLGTEPRDEKGYAAALFETLMDRRYDAAKRTIITTNITADQFKATYCGGPTGRLYDRIREVGSFVRVAGDSMRKPETT